jgi:hypothetical protein
MQGSIVHSLRFFTFLLVITTLSACKGNSSSDPGLSTNSSSPSAGSICTNKEILVISGIEVRLADFDTDNNGCLSTEEYSYAFQFAAEQATQQLEDKSIHVTGTNLSTSTSKIIKARVAGSSETSNQLVQLHSNMSSGNFFIEVEIDNKLLQEESLRVFFDDESYKAEQNATAPPSFNVNPPLQGLATVVVSCSYQNDFTIDCDSAAVYPTENLSTDNVRTAPLDLTFNLDWTFSSRSLPQAGNIIISYCTGIAAESKCFNNFVEIGTSFN